MAQVSTIQISENRHSFIQLLQFFLLLFKAGIKHNGGVGKKPSREELVWRFTDLPKCTEVLEKFSLQKDLKTKLVDAVLLPKTQLKH